MEFRIKIFCCGYGNCWNEYTTKQNLARHVRIIHELQKKVRCGVCGKEFLNEVNLKEHSYIHTGEKPYKCPTCFSNFRHKSKLGSHIRAHIGGIFKVKTKEIEDSLNKIDLFS